MAEFANSLVNPAQEVACQYETPGRKDVLTSDELEQYSKAMGKTLSLGCAKWVESGGSYA